MNAGIRCLFHEARFHQQILVLLELFIVSTQIKGMLLASVFCSLPVGYHRLCLENATLELQLDFSLSGVTLWAALE